MCAPALIVPIVSAVIGAGSSMYAAKKADSAAARDREQQKKLADRQAATRSEMEKGNVNLNLDDGAGAPAGLGNTFLTGAGGIANDQLNLGGNKTLGG